MKVGERLKQVDPWEHICIGSDFDGLINPIKTCVSSSHFYDLPDKIKEAFEAYAPVPFFNQKYRAGGGEHHVPERL